MDHEEAVRIGNVNPADTIQKLKLQIKRHPDIGINMLPLRDFTLKNADGDSLTPENVIMNCLDDNDVVQVVHIIHIIYRHFRS